ncbi:MAG TPA: EB domain-containing protein [Polyangia bacterium]|jgi:hypothetical protein
MKRVALRIALVFGLTMIAACGDGGGGGATCTAGTASCTCRPDGTCDATLTCQAGHCVAACVAGTLGCACLPDGTCGGGLTCGAASTCESPPACTQGTEGCGCRADLSCGSAADGTQLVCNGGTCGRPSCPAGTLGCGCVGGSLCGAGLVCKAGTCGEDDGGGPESTVVPAAAACYTPCSESLIRADGTYVACSAEGLLAGCVGDAACTDGSCVQPGASPPACAIGTECPDFQTCIGGKCYSNCEYDSDCTGDRRCHRKVCRLACDATASTCPNGTSCVTSDGEHGFCMPVAAPAAQAQREVIGTFSIDTALLEFTSSKIADKFTIKNEGPVFQEFTVRKLRHTEYSAAGEVVVDQNPLSWMQMGAGSPAQVQELTVGVDAGTTVDIQLANVANATLSRWDGIIEIASPQLGTRQVNLSYASKPEGRWSGKMYYFVNFRDDGVDAWMANKGNAALLNQVRNAFIRKWAEFKAAIFPLREWEAILTATQTGSWQYDSVKKICPTAGAPDPDKACYLYDNTGGNAIYSTSLATYPIPTGVAELPIAMNLHAPNAAAPAALEGKIVTGESLHYAGDPAVTIQYQADPTGCTVNNNGTCIMGISSFQANVVVGGRYPAKPDDANCAKAAAGTFELGRLPWLVPGFQQDTAVDPTTHLRYRYECRDQLFPYGADPGSYPANVSFAASNPIPDGKSRRRTLELVDGALINADTLFVIFREKFPSFLGSTDSSFAAYGYMLLKRNPANLDSDAYRGATQADNRLDANIDTLTCRQDLLDKVLGAGSTLSAANAEQAAHGLIDGIATTSALVLVTSPESVHFYCEDTGQFDGGPDPLTRTPCPAGSRVAYFTLQNRPDLTGEACQKTGSCQETLNAWQTNHTYGLRLDPVWRCTDSNQVYCDTDRLDLRSGKQFFAATEAKAAFVPLRPAIELAFRYKTRFRNRTGTSVGFAPVTCAPNSDAVPYCYDPPAIEDIRGRVDCALMLFSDPTLRSGLLPATAAMLRGYLGENFSYTEEWIAGQPLPFIHDGFERLNAELLIMEGDEAYTRAFASRFDLSGSSLVSFEGSLFEPGGINLSGAAGYEMYNLYLATQYYQLALDRFYVMGTRLLPLIKELQALPNNPAQRIVSSYFARLIRASTQKSRAWDEVAKRYQNFNRPELARMVIERAYTAAYLESVVLSRMMLRLISFASPEDRDQIVKEAETAQLSYRAALLEMRDFYKDISDNINFFGYPADYVPFPAVDATDTNAVTKVIGTAQQKLAVAADKEALALQVNRSFETDAAAFQNELTKIRNDYEDQLADLCGTFQAEDGKLYPAIPKYAYLSKPTAAMGDPCGLVGNGALHDAMAQSEIAALDFRSVVAARDKTLAEIDIERDRVTQQCQLTTRIALEDFGVEGQVDSLKESIDRSRFIISSSQRLLDKAGEMAGLTKCSLIVGVANGGDCIPAAIASTIFAAVSATLEVVAITNEALILDQQARINDLQAKHAMWKTLTQCESALIDSNARVKGMMLQMEEHSLAALRADYRMRLAFSEIVKLRHKATRQMSEQQETEQLTINLEAARNDPNVRIYKNDDILTADRTFHDAVREAYRATKVYEYYTSQTYEHLGDLFLVRMVSHGDITLEAYLAGLENAFAAFQEQYGQPDLRVAIISLRDDVLAIPRTDATGRSYSQAERIDLLRAALRDSSRLDGSGYLTLPFATKMSSLSPLTRNHKVSYLEAEIVGSDVGDTVGRVYVRQKGTAAVSTLSESVNYYAFPERIAVVNPFFNGERVFVADVYRNARLKDRPFVNTDWELVVNQKDESVNKDINLQSLTDIRLYVYYTDFTQL